MSIVPWNPFYASREPLLSSAGASSMCPLLGSVSLTAAAAVAADDVEGMKQNADHSTDQLGCSLHTR